MARAMQRIPLAARGQVRHGVLPLGAMVARIGMWKGAHYAWVWLDPNETRMQSMDFLIIASGDVVMDDAFYPLNSFSDRADDGVWFGLVKYGPEIK
jgi:hypothetical protein